MIKVDIRITLGGEEIWTGQAPMNIAMGLAELSGMNKEVDEPNNTTVNEK